MTDPVTPRIKLTPAPGWKAYTNLPADHPIHSLVGQIAAKWAEVEHELDRGIWRLAKVDDKTGACLTAQILGSGNRLTVLWALCVHRGLDEKIFSELSSLRGPISNCQNLRNRILHDAWYMQEPNEEPQQFKSMARDEYLFGFYQVDEEFLKKALAKMQRRLQEQTDSLKSFLPRPGDHAAALADRRSIAAAILRARSCPLGVKEFIV
jgi:hypothetical protein